MGVFNKSHLKSTMKMLLVVMELVSDTIDLKMSPITNKTEITNAFKNFNSLFNITNEQTFFFKNVNLMLCGYGWGYLTLIYKKCLVGYDNFT